MERFQKLAGIKPLHEAGMLNEIEHCDPDTGEPCTSTQTCTYQGSAFQYVCVDNEPEGGNLQTGSTWHKEKLKNTLDKHAPTPFKGGRNRMSKHQSDFDRGVSNKNK